MYTHIYMPYSGRNYNHAHMQNVLTQIQYNLVREAYMLHACFQGTKDHILTEDLHWEFCCQSYH